MAAVKKYWFLTTYYEKSKVRMRCLEGQMLSDGEPVDDSFNVQCDKNIRSLVPIGTIFATSSLEKKSAFYQAGDLFTIEKHEGVPHADEEAQRQYKAHRGGRTEPSTERVSTAETSAPSSKRTVLARLIKDDAIKPPSVEDGFYVDADQWYLLIRNIRKQIPTMILGPTGTGKTELVNEVMKKLYGIKKESRVANNLAIYDMGSMYDPISGLLGVHRLSEKGASEFDYAKFTHSIQNEGVVLLDELSRAPVTTNNILFPCLDSRRQLPVEIAGGKDMRSIPLHEKACFIATANVGGEYTGTNIMDRALVDRFFMIEMDYLTEAQETQVLQVRTSVDKADAQLVVKVATQTRNLYKKGDISSSISMRHTLAVCEMIRDGFSRLRALELVLLPLFEGSRTEGERAVIANILVSR